MMGTQTITSCQTLRTSHIWNLRNFHAFQKLCLNPNRPGATRIASSLSFPETVDQGGYTWQIVLSADREGGIEKPDDTFNLTMKLGLECKEAILEQHVRYLLDSFSFYYKDASGKVFFLGEKKRFPYNEVVQDFLSDTITLNMDTFMKEGVLLNGGRDLLLGVEIRSLIYGNVFTDQNMWMKPSTAPRYTAYKGNQKLCDVKVALENKIEIPAHKIILAAASETFKFKFESEEWDKETLSLQDTSKEVFEAFLDYAYEEIFNVPTSILCDMIAFCHLYVVPELKEYCEEKLIFEIDDSTVVKLLDVAFMYACYRLQGESCRYFAANFKRLGRREEYKILLKKDPEIGIAITEELCGYESVIL